jgi:Niemann-Pick C1 protein
MPHWTGILFVAPMVAIIYVDLLGFIQWFGIDVNGVTYVSLMMAIGLLVDYMMHVTLRYYETPVSSSRDAKVKDVLRTMGASVVLGGLSTFVGIIPLMFSASDIIYIFVVTFSGVVFLGKW